MQKPMLILDNERSDFLFETWGEKIWIMKIILNLSIER